MEAKMIANMAPVKPVIPKILIDATIKVVQDGMRPDDLSKPMERSFAVHETSSSTGRSLKKKGLKKDEGKLRKRLQRRDEDEEEPARTYRNFDERRLGFLVIGDQHRLAGAAGGQLQFVYPSAPPLDFSFCMINKIEEIVTEGEHPQTKRNCRIPPRTPDDRYKTSSLWLSYNVISTVEGLINVLYKILDGGPFGLCWIDLSFNAISKLDGDTFSQLPNLKILYLHGNSITDMTEVPNLEGLKNLVSLTLHGNPVEEEEGYRISVLYYLPDLTHLDFVAVTKEDLDMSRELGAKYAPYWEKRHDNLEKLYQAKKRAGEVTYTERVMLGDEGIDDDDDANLEDKI